ncbi:MAG: class I SAM-dependent methyltransferase [Sulfurovum sp.]|nr:class I SAM-dependent methyltransferase [Sulfurovum sp.]
MTFTTDKMQTILPILQKALETKDTISFSILNPDIQTDIYAGTTITIEKCTYLYRGYKSWVELAELLQCKMLTPKENTYPLITLTFRKLKNDSFHTENRNNEKYGSDSLFFKINKMEEPAFFYYYNQALDNIKIEDRRSILNLGINRGDEFQIIKDKLDTKEYQRMDLVGIDHSQSAINYAKDTFTEDNVTFYIHDINYLDALSLGNFDLLISIGTLQSPRINFKPFFMKLVQEYLKKDAAIILGFPNSRWMGGEMIYGAKVPNYIFSELGHLFSDVIFCKKYLQQKKYRVTITGKEYIFLTATKIG